MVREQVLVPVDGLVDGQGDGPAGSTDELAPIASSGEFTAGEEFPVYARGQWRYYEDRSGRHWERITHAI